MSAGFKEISLRGKLVKVPAVELSDRTVVTLGKWVRMASVHDEVWLEGDGVSDPVAAVAKIKGVLPADVFTFAQKIPDTQPKYSYRMDWDNVAAIPLTTYEDWWENKVPQETRKNCRRAGRRGVTVRLVTLDDPFIRGITEIYNETPVRQGKPFSKYGMDFDRVKAEVVQLQERSQFIGAYFGDELIGFVKMVFIGKVASILSINSKNSHFDKRPTNVLLAKAVEIAVQRGMTHLIYGRYVYGNKQGSPLTEFKRRNGFERVNLPRYYIPLNVRGRIILALNAHLGLVGMLPGPLMDFLVKVRGWWFEKLLRRTEGAKSDGASDDASESRSETNKPAARSGETEAGNEKGKCVASRG